MTKRRSRRPLISWRTRPRKVRGRIGWRVTLAFAVIVLVAAMIVQRAEHAVRELATSSETRAH